MTQSSRSPLLIYYSVTALVAVFAYFYALGSEHIPTSVDELTYVHVTRETAASGHLLPLRSEIMYLRNIKPPLLFWQGIASTDWGRNWSRWHFRYPSLIYTLLTGALVFLLGRRFSGQTATGLLAFLVFLAFFSTYRYGRIFMTDPPVVFWLFLPFFIMLYWERSAFDSRILVPLLLGVIVGVGVLHKSLALAAPVLIALGWWFWRRREYRLSAFLVRDVWKLAVIGCMAAGIFALWFVFDPEREVIWRQFVLKENMSKFNQPLSAYFANLLWGKEHIWKILVATPVNAGLLALPVGALFYVAFRNRSAMTEGEKLLWMLVLTYLVVFALPNHRSERYLLPAMPVLAILTALNWDRISRHVFAASMIGMAVLIGVLLYLSICLQTTIAAVPSYPALHWFLLGVTALLVLTGVFLLRALRSSMLMAVFLFYLCFASFMRPLDGPIGTYSADVQEAVRGRDLWVPSKFNAREEGYRFLLPGANLHPYNADFALTFAEPAEKYPLFVIRLPINQEDPSNGKILGRRLDLSSAHKLRQIIEMVRGAKYEQLFVKELLIEAPGI